MRVREHKGFGHGLRPGTSQDINCTSCQSEKAEGVMPRITGPRPLHEIATEIIMNWPEPYFGAVPYIHAMRQLDKITDPYGADDAETIVRYFLSNAKTWRGDTARRIKVELKALL